jgi:hypothetical protein
LSPKLPILIISLSLSLSLSLYLVSLSLSLSLALSSHTAFPLLPLPGDADVANGHVRRCNDIYTARYHGDLLMEEELFAMLVDIYRRSEIVCLSARLRSCMRDGVAPRRVSRANR